MSIKKAPLQVLFIFDSQISKSGDLTKLLCEKIARSGLKGNANTSRHVDHDLKCSYYIVASSDGVIIDAAEKVVNFLFCMICEIPYLEARIAEAGRIHGVL